MGLASWGKNSQKSVFGTLFSRKVLTFETCCCQASAAAACKQAEAVYSGVGTWGPSEEKAKWSRATCRRWRHGVRQQRWLCRVRPCSLHRSLPLPLSLTPLSSWLSCCFLLLLSCSHPPRTLCLPNLAAAYNLSLSFLALSLYHSLPRSLSLGDLVLCARSRVALAALARGGMPILSVLTDENKACGWSAELCKPDDAVTGATTKQLLKSLVRL